MVEETKESPRQPGAAERTATVFHKDGATDVDGDTVQKAFRDSLMLLAKVDPESAEATALMERAAALQASEEGTQKPKYDRGRSIVLKSQPSLAGGLAPADPRKTVTGSMPSRGALLRKGTLVATAWDGQTVRKKDQDLEIQEFSSLDEESDGLENALQQVREIPLELYLSQEKADKVKNARERRKPIQEKFVKKVTNKHARGSDENGTRRARSNFRPSDWSGLSSGEKERRVGQQYRGVERFCIHEGWRERVRGAMRRGEAMSLEERFRLKRRQAEINQRRRENDKRIPIEDRLSNWSEQVPEIEPLVSRDIQYEARVAKPHLQTVDADLLPSYANGEHRLFNHSVVPALDDHSVQASGMIRRRARRQQTLTQYELVPEVIYSAMEQRLRDLALELIGPTVKRVQETAAQQQTLLLKNHQIDGRLRECQLGLKKQLNMKAEFEAVNARIESQELKTKRVETEFLNHLHHVENKLEKQAAQLRVVQSDLKAQARFVQKKNDDSTRMQEILGSFKDRLMEKYATLADEFTEQFKNLNQKHLNLSDAVTRVQRLTDTMNGEAGAMKVVQAAEQRELETAKEDIIKLNECFKFAPRIAALEGQAKSDLLSVTRKLNEILYDNKRNLKRTEALKLIYALQTSMAKCMLDPLKHRSGMKATKRHPKLDSATQSLLNLIEWQMTFVTDQPFQERNVINVMNRMQNEVETDLRRMRTKRFKIELNAAKVGRTIERADSLQLHLYRADNIPKVEMPVPQKKSVKFAVDTAPEKNQESTISLQSARSQAAAINKKPSKSSLRKINKILEPTKQRVLTRLSAIKRSNSYQWKPLYKPTIDNLYNDPTALRLMDKLRKKLDTDAAAPGDAAAQAAARRQAKMERSLAKRTSPAPRERKSPRRERAEASPRPKVPRAKRQKTKKEKSPEPKKSAKIDVRQLEPAQPGEEVKVPPSPKPARRQSPARRASPRRSPRQRAASRESRAPVAEPPAPTQPPAPQAPAQTQMVATHATALSSDTVNDRASVGRPSDDQGATQQMRKSAVTFESRDSKSRTSSRKGTRHGRSQKSSARQDDSSSSGSEEDSDLFSSEDDQEDIASIFYDEFVPRDSLDEELMTFKEKFKKELLGETKKMIEKEASEIVEEQVEVAQINIGDALQSQLAESQEAMKGHMQQEVVIVKNMIDKIENHVLPSNLKLVQDQLDAALETQRAELKASLAYTNDNIRTFREKVEFFETDVTTTQTKFKRLVSDQDIFKARIERIQKRTQEMVKVMRSEQLACGKIMSTLVELEFIQQSLDFQDEFDKTEMNLYGLHDLNLTMEEFLAKSTEMAERKLRNENLKKAHQLDKERKNQTASSKMGSHDDLEEDDDRQHYQAIKMDENWPDYLHDDGLRKQIHQAFKLACVYYKPSPVLYRGSSFNRRSLIEAKRQMLDSDWHLLMKFQPFKRMWGEDSEVNFFDQFAQKLKTLIQGIDEKKDMQALGADIAEETFVKIMEGTNIYDMKADQAAAGSDHEGTHDDTQEDHRMLAALKEAKQFNVSSSVNMGLGIDATQSSIRLHSGESQELGQLSSRFQNSPRTNQGSQFISNRVSKQNSPQGGSGQNTIESRTRSMLNALQGKSMFGPTIEESMFSTTEAREQVAQQSRVKIQTKQKNPTKRQRNQNRSVQQYDQGSQNILAGAELSQLVHTPFLMNSSQVVAEPTNRLASPESDVGSLFGKVSRKNKDLIGQPNRDDIRRKSSLRKNLDLMKHPMASEVQTASARNQEQQFWRENPMFEMRPLIGKGEIRKSDIKMKKVTASLNREAHEQDQNNVGISTQFSLSPWNRTGFKLAPQTGNHRHDQAQYQVVDMAIYGKKELQKSREPQQPASKQSSRKANNALQRSQVIKPTNVNLPLHLPISQMNLNMQSPEVSDSHRGPKNQNVQTSISQSVLTLPQVRNLSSSNKNLVNLEREHHQLGGLGVNQKQYSSLAESRFNNPSTISKNQSPGIWQHTNPRTLGGQPPVSARDHLASQTSLSSSKDGGVDMMSSRLDNNNGNVDSTTFNTQRLKDIVSAKKQHLLSMNVEDQRVDHNTNAGDTLQ